MRKRRVRNENEITYLPAEKAAIRALVEALKILSAQWCFDWAYDFGDGMQGRTYRTLIFAVDSSFSEIMEDESKCGEARVHLHKECGEWIATSAEVSVPEGNGLFRFEWREGRIAETQQVEDQGLEWQMHVWDPQVNYLTFDPDYSRSEGGETGGRNERC